MSAASLHNRAGTILAIGVVVLSAAPALAQRVITPGSLTAWGPGGSALTTELEEGNVLNTNWARTGAGGGFLYQWRGTPTEDGNAQRDRLTYVFRPLQQTFLLSSAGDIVVPVIWDGFVQFSGHLPGPNNLGYADVSINVALYRETGVGTGVYALVQATNFGPTTDALALNPPNGTTYNLNGTEVVRFANQTGGDNRRYRVQVSVQTMADSSFGSPGGNNLGASTTINFDSNAAHRGLVYSVSAEPANYTGNSRGAVGAQQARTQFGVNGSGPNVIGSFPSRSVVAVLEPGVTYSNHAALNNRVTILDNGGAATDQSEHTLAVAGIIAGNGPDESSSGIAPGARIISASISDYAGTIAAAQAVVNNVGANTPLVVNYSASDGGCTVQALDGFIRNNTLVTWCAASGNEQLSGPWPSFPPGGRPPSSGNVETPDYAYNIISVGAMEAGFNRPTDFSSTTLGAQPQAPHIMAPGEFTLAPASRDTNGNGQVDDYTRSFIGNDWNQNGGATTGRIAGTSFAAPHVAGAVALMHDYATQNPVMFDATALDHRVMKAIVLAGASTTGITDRAGNAWQQDTTGGGFDGDPLLVHRSLDPNLGSGMLHIPTALRIQSGGEARVADYTPANAPRNAQIQPSWFTANGAIWDYETVGAAAGGINGTVDYFLPTTILAGTFLNPSDEEVTGVRLTPDFGFLRSCLTWDRTVTGATYDPLSNLQLRLYADRPDNINNLPGFDPTNPGADILIAMTDGVGENIRLLDMDTIHSFYEIHSPDQVLAGWSFYLQVTNLSDTATTYGIALSLIPTPSGAALLGVMGIFASRRRRA